MRGRDQAVQKTDDDAATSKYSAVSKGYYADQYLEFFCPRPPPPRLPLINIGTYCRVKGTEALVDGFLHDTKANPRRAIVSLGAGSDTRPFHLLPQHAGLEYHELDFAERTKHKAQIISDNPLLHTAVGVAPLKHAPFQPQSIEYNAELHSESYHLYPADLRTLGGIGGVPHALQQLFDQQIPTLVLSECCLCYMPPEASDGILRFFARKIPPPLLSVVAYEPIALDDEFGRVMANNLAMRGLSLPSFTLYNSAESQKNRLASIIAPSEAGAVDITTVYKEWLGQVDQERIARLEFLDEVEEMYLLMRHYCIAWTRSQPQK